MGKTEYKANAHPAASVQSYNICIMYHVQNTLCGRWNAVAW